MSVCSNQKKDPNSLTITFLSDPESDVHKAMESVKEDMEIIMHCPRRDLPKHINRAWSTPSLSHSYKERLADAGGSSDRGV